MQRILCNHGSSPTHAVLKRRLGLLTMCNDRQRSRVTHSCHQIGWCIWLYWHQRFWSNCQVLLRLRRKRPRGLYGLCHLVFVRSEFPYVHHYLRTELVQIVVGHGCHPMVRDNHGHGVNHTPSPSQKRRQACILLCPRKHLYFLHCLPSFNRFDPPLFKR